MTTVPVRGAAGVVVPASTGRPSRSAPCIAIEARAEAATEGRVCSAGASRRCASPSAACSSSSAR